jgi:hypothetical protein
VVLRLRRTLVDDVRPPAILLIAPHPRLLPVQQVGQNGRIRHVGRRHQCGVSQLGLAVHPHVRLHAEVPLVALLRLVHLGVALLLAATVWADEAEDTRGNGELNQSFPSSISPDTVELREPDQLDCPGRLFGTITVAARLRAV